MSKKRRLKVQKDNRMNLISQLFFAVVISSVTGSLLLFIWWAVRRLFMAVNPKLVNVTLRVVSVIYMMPLGYIAIHISENRWLKGHVRAWNLYFARTKWLTILIQLMAVAWFLIASGFTFLRIMQNLAWCRKLKDNIPIEEELAAEVFSRICQKMGVQQGAVSLQRNPLMVSPMIVKAYHPQIILPEQEYTEDELELIFYHELSHYKHHDLKWKVAVVILTTIQGFNPVARRLLSIVSFWSECMADASALDVSGNIHNARQYFEKIERLLPEIEGKKRDKYLFAALYRDENVMFKRVEFIRCYQHARICSRQAAAAILTCFIFASILLTIITGILMAELHKFIYRATADYVVMQGKGIPQSRLKEKECVLDVQKENLLSVRKRKNEEEIIYHIKCSIEPGKCQVTRSLSVQDGQIMHLSVLAKFGMADYSVGILDEEGNARYVVGKNNAVTHGFLIGETGRYSIFVQNNSANKPIPDFAACIMLKSP